MAVVEVKVPDIGDFKEVAIIEVLVKPGDAIKAEQSLITVESDKASMEIPSSTAGVVKDLKVKVGDKVNEGSVVLTLETSGAAAAPASSPWTSRSTVPPAARSAPRSRPATCTPCRRRCASAPGRSGSRCSTLAASTASKLPASKRSA